MNTVLTDLVPPEKEKEKEKKKLISSQNSKWQSILDFWDVLNMLEPFSSVQRWRKEKEKW
jgi:hypothetical protein